MPIVHVPERSSGPSLWHALVRFFRFRGRVGPVRVEARLGVFELGAPETMADVVEIRPSGRDANAA